ncbi:MAG: hypothetical protein HOO06_02290 [Bdellovibrionaceae bacterium]|jgi:hypothetical protein|nr:hypothetical protein [Pseudobdellovibrionaceae bacterium]
MKQILLIITTLGLFNFSHAFIEVTNTGSTVGNLVSKSKFKASTGADLRHKKKMGLGFAAVGTQGLLGLGLEMNFTPYISSMLSFGLGDHYQTFNIHIKRYIYGKYFQPYVGVGYSRWYTTGSETHNFSQTNPEFLAKNFLNEHEKRGVFDEHFIYPSAGIQFLQLTGPWAGSSIYAELILMIDIDDFVTSPTGGLGFIRYF